MSVRFYFDEHVHGVLAKALPGRAIDVLTVQDDGMDSAADLLVFERAIELGRVLVSYDYDMLEIAHEHLTSGRQFNGLLFLLLAPLSAHIESLAYIGAEIEPEELANSVIFLPL